jgi:hypothetical protein
MIAERDVTRDRFFSAIAEKVRRDAIAEAHLFQPIKQGSTESRVAVIAVAEPRVAPADGRRDANEANLVVYTARYRLTQKGPDRGKWEFNIQAEADAPLLTIDKVVQGVQRRSGDAEGPEKLSGDEFRALVPVAAESQPQAQG